MGLDISRETEWEGEQETAGSEREVEENRERENYLSEDTAATKGLVRTQTPLTVADASRRLRLLVDNF